jgi:Family of unknown function (DUF6152)
MKPNRASKSSRVALRWWAGFTVAGAAAAGVGLAAARPAWAHHSFAMFDFERLTSFRGATVKEFQWTNPHVILWVEVDPSAERQQENAGAGGGKAAAPRATETTETAGKPASGKPELWSVELTSPGNLTRVGWSKRSFSAGDRIDLDIHPLRDGRHGGAFKKATVLATGQVWTSDLRQQEKSGLP